MRTMLVAIGLLTAGTVSAKPLPSGMKVVLNLGRPYIQQGAVTVALRDDDLADYEKVVKAELAADGKMIHVTAARCSGTLPDDVFSIPLAKVQGRIDNGLGLVALGKKKYPDAIAKLTSAVAKDPETPAHATNLLTAQLLGKKTAVAGQTLAVHGKRNPVWFAWRLAVEADLAGATTLKGAQILVADKPGTATLAKLGDHDLAVTTHSGGMAALRTTSAGSPGTTDVDVISLVTGKLLVRLPVIAKDDACDTTAVYPCADEIKTLIAARMVLVNTLLASLGFEITPKAFVDVRNGDPVTKDGVQVEISDDKLTASRGATEEAVDVDGGVWAIAFTPKAVVAKVSRRNLNACNDGSSRFVGLALPLR